MSHVIKRSKKVEIFDESKLYKSIFNACLAVHEINKQAETISKKVVENTKIQLRSKSEVTSKDIRKVAGENLSKINPHAGFLYLHHRIMW